MRVDTAGQFDHPWEAKCYMCNRRCAIRLDTTEFGTIWLCGQHFFRYLHGDTGWWALIKLTTEAVDKVE